MIYLPVSVVKKNVKSVKPQHFEFINYQKY